MGQVSPIAHVFERGRVLDYDQIPSTLVAAMAGKVAYKSKTDGS